MVHSETSEAKIHLDAHCKNEHGVQYYWIPNSGNEIVNRLPIAVGRK